jgi:hypothetical protein
MEEKNISVSTIMLVTSAVFGTAGCASMYLSTKQNSELLGNIGIGLALVGSGAGLAATCTKIIETMYPQCEYQGTVQEEPKLEKIK